MFFVSCGKNKEVTQTKNVDSTANKNTAVDQDKQRLEKENQELKEQLKQQENKIDQEPMGGDEETIEISDQKVRKDVVEYFAKSDKGAWTDRKYDHKVQTTDVYERNKTGDGYKIMCNVKVTGGLGRKEPTYYKLTMNYMKFGGEWKLNISSSEQRN